MPPGELIRLRPASDGAFGPEHEAGETSRAAPKPEAVFPWEGETRRKPVLPPWLADKATRDAALAWALRHGGGHVAFHAVRVPFYGLRLGLVHIPVGAARAVHGTWHWCACRESAPLIRDAIARNDPKGYVHLASHNSARARVRTALAVAGVASGAGGVVIANHYWHPAWICACCLAGAVLGYLGKPKGEPYFQPAVIGSAHRKLSADVVTNALGRLSIAEMNKWLAKGGNIPVMIGRDGPGWLCEAELPPGVTPSMIMDRREQFASALRRRVGCVWPEQAPDDHAGKLHLYIADQPLSKARQPPWPLARRGQGDLFRPLPFGYDQRSKLVTLTLIFESVLVGSMPRNGKTAALRVMGLAGALDPNAEIHAFDLKGTGDLSALGKVAHRYACGADEGTLAACMDSLREVHGYLTARSKTIDGFPSAICPERKVTPALSADRRNGLWPVLLMIDEVQELYESEYAAEAEALTVAIMKRGPAQGIILVLATQRPDAKSLPKRISALAGIRFCLRIVDENSNNMILGAGMYAGGFRATMFTRSDKGVGWLAGHADDPQIVRTSWIDAPAADKIADRAHALRAAAGTLTGEAARDYEPPEVSLLRDILDVMPEAEAWLDDLAGRLAKLRPLLYAGWDSRQLGAAVRGFGVTPCQLNRDGVNRNGIARADVVSALDRRMAHA